VATDDVYDEVVDGANNFQKEGASRDRSVKSYGQVKSPPSSPIDKPKDRLEAVYRNIHRQAHPAYHASTKAAGWQCNLEVDRMLTEADFHSQMS